MEDSRLFKKRILQISKALTRRQQLIIEDDPSLSDDTKISAHLDPRLAARRRIERYLQNASKNNKSMKELARNVTLKHFGPTGRKQKLITSLLELSNQDLNSARLNSIKLIVAQLAANKFSQ